MKVWDTQTLPLADRFAYWREVLCEAFTSLDSKPHETPDRRSIVTLHEFADVNGVDLSSFSQRVSHGLPEIQRYKDDFFFVNYQIDGRCGVEQDGRRICAAPGQFYIVDTTRPYHLEFMDAFHTISFRVPRGQLSPLIGDPRRMTARSVDDREPLGNLAGAYMRGLLRTAREVPSDARTSLADTLARLIAVAVSGQAPRDAESFAHTRRAFHDSIQRYVCDHSANPELSVGAVAARFRVSPRTVQALFAERGGSFTQTLLDRRLEAARTALAHRGASITQIALDSGFGDISYFGRAFRLRYGCSPREWRHEAAEARAAAAE